MGDVEVARSIGAQLTLAGLDVWFDEWEIQAGDSIPGKLNEGLGAFEVFVLVWSARSKKSNWVRQELQSALVRSVERGGPRIVPCILDETPLPPLIADRRYIRFQNMPEGIDQLLSALTGSATRRQRLLALQSAIDNLDVSWITHPALNPLVCCPKCGDTDSLEPWQATDDERGDLYAGMRCKACGWENGGEV